MRTSFRTLAAAASVAATAAFLCAGTALFAGGEDDDDDDGAGAKIAQAALDKAVQRGKELYESKALGKKTCASCHENPEKPNLDLKTRAFSYPAYSKKKKSIVSMGQKINEMLTARSGAAKEMELGSADLVALEAYVASLKKK
jgi:cytochrome c